MAMALIEAERLLIADDDADLLAAYVLFFDSHGYAIKTAHDGVAALALYQVWRPNAVILDVQMPRLDGRAVAKRIRQHGHVPAPLLIAVSGLSSLADEAESLRSGFDHHFVKPAHLPFIWAAIAFRMVR
jgi:DNA-binding response OmpR family regulator